MCVTLFLDAHFRRVYWDGDRQEAELKGPRRRRFRKRSNIINQKLYNLTVYTVNHCIIQFSTLVFSANMGMVTALETRARSPFESRSFNY